MQLPRVIVIAPFLAAVTLLCVLGVAIVDILSATRAYVGGESLYAKGQKDAVYHLSQYARGGVESDYRRFLDALRVPIGDGQARTELERDEPDVELVRAGLLQGGNHADDIAGMIRLFRNFGHSSLMVDAIQIWREGDRAIVQLQALGEKIHLRIAGGDHDSAQLQALLAQLPELSDRLTDLGRNFAGTLGATSRTVQQVVLFATITAGLLLALAGALLTRNLLHRQSLAEKALRDSNERWEMAAAAAEIGVFDCDVGAGRVVLDERAAALFDLGPSAPPVLELTQMTASLHPDDRTKLHLALEQAVVTGLPMVLRYRVVGPAGEVRHHELNARVGTDAKTERRRVVGILWNVTTDVQREQLQLDKEAAERANTAKTTFLSRVSHELRTPLNAVLGFAQVLLADQKSPLDEAQHQHVGHIRRAGTHLLALVDDMLDLVTIESDAVKLNEQTLELDSVVEESRRWVEPMAQAGGIATRSFATSARVRADARRLRQVLSNLLSNAVKYNRPGGSVTMGLVPQADARWWVLSIRDTGRGMTPEQLAQLFQPFNRLGAERGEIPGTGIGLSLARKLVESMNGRLEVFSTPGVGSEFRVWLPAAPASAASPPADSQAGDLATPASRTEAAALVLLYIEDNAVNVQLVREVLAGRREVEVHVANTGTEGVASAQALRPDVVLVDMELPDIDGFEVLRRLRADAVLHATPCIALSANAMPEYIARARAAGFDDYWTKPIDFNRFLGAIDALSSIA